MNLSPKLKIKTSLKLSFKMVPAINKIESAFEAQKKKTFKSLHPERIEVGEIMIVLTYYPGVRPILFFQLLDRFLVPKNATY